jgi:hypothetical protein
MSVLPDFLSEDAYEFLFKLGQVGLGRVGLVEHLVLIED